MTGSARSTRARGHRRTSSSSTTSRCSATARSTGSGCESSGEGLVGPAAHQVPGHHGARGRAGARAPLGGASGAPSSSTTPAWPSPGCGAPRSRRPATGRAPCAPWSPSTSRSRPSVPSAPTRSPPGAAAAPRRSRSPSPASRWARTRSGSPPYATRSARAAGSASTRTAPGRSARPSRRCADWSGRRAVSSTSSSPARVSRSSPSYAARSTCPSRPTSRSGGRPTPTACATSRPPTSRSSRSSRSAASARACASPRTSGCRSWCRRHWRPRWGSPPASRWPPRCPSCRTPAAWPRCGSSRTTSSTEPLVPVDGVLPVRTPVVDPAALDRLAAAPDRVAHWTARLGRGAGAQGGGSRVVTNSSSALARAVLDALLQAGVTDLVAAPGSRNGPLLFAAYDADAAGLLRLHTRVDERTAGYLALGLAKVSHRRAAVLCTSGTAVANLHPAMLEAAHAGVPLVALTADRPARFRGTNANQTTDQVGVFGPLVPLHDLSGTSRGMLNTDEVGTASGPSLPDLLAVDGPVHVNVAFDEPLVPDDRWEPPPPPAREPGDRRRLRTTGLGDPDPARPAHGRRRRRRRGTARPGARRGCRLAASRRAHQRLTHGHARAALLPAAARRRARLAHRARGRGRPPHAVETGDPAAGPRRRRGLVGPDRGRLGRPAVRGRPRRRAPDRRAKGDDPAWLASWREADASGRSRARRAARRRGRADAVRGRRRRRPPAAGRRTPRRRSVEPAARPRPDGAPLRRRRPAQGHRQPRPVRHRRHPLDRDRRGPRQAIVVTARSRWSAT